MTDTDQTNAHFDVRQSVSRRNTLRLVIVPGFSLLLIALGLWLIPAGTVMNLHFAAMETWSGWAFFGVILIGCGIYGVLKEIIFAWRARKTSGEWHFRLTDNDLLWHVPDHAHGREDGFSAQLDELKEIELRTIQEDDQMDVREYWVHFTSGQSLQLQSYSGISLSWLVEKICAAGVPYRETCVRA